MATRVFCASLKGIESQIVRVEIDSTPGIHTFTIVGLGDKAVQESIQRIDSAIKHSTFSPPRSKNKRFIVNLAPADVKKEGPGYDLAIAIAFLKETKQCQGATEDLLVVGELGLDGSLSHSHGVLSATLCAKEAGIATIIVPSVNAHEAAVVEGIRVLGASTLGDVVAHLNGTRILEPVVAQEGGPRTSQDDSFAHIQGQETAKRALIIAAAGGHNLLMTGTPGSGKTLLARSIVGILPALSLKEAIEVAKIQSSLGMLTGSVLELTRPFCAPHHTSSPAALVGGGSTIRPGQITMAHRGVLFLDELPEFARNVLEALRQPLEDGVVTVSRATASHIFPAQFMLVAAMNPCPCGNLGDTSALCTCTSGQILRYSKRISGPLLDRLDMHIHVTREKITQSLQPIADMTAIRDQIQQARQQQHQRLTPLSLETNSELSHRTLARFTHIAPEAHNLLTKAAQQHQLSMRTYHKIQKVARTIADLDQSAEVHAVHIAEALALRIQNAKNAL